MNLPAHEQPPAFLAACLAATGGHLVASLVLALLSAPLALVTWTGLAFGGGSTDASFRLLLPWLVLLATQPLLAAWVVRSGLRVFGAGTVTYARACGAMLVGLVITALCALVLPPEVALPVLGYAWTGALAAGSVLAQRRRASS